MDFRANRSPCERCQPELSEPTPNVRTSFGATAANGTRAGHEGAAGDPWPLRAIVLCYEVAECVRRPIGLRREIAGREELGFGFDECVNNIRVEVRASFLQND